MNGSPDPRGRIGDFFANTACEEACYCEVVDIGHHALLYSAEVELGDHVHRDEGFANRIQTPEFVLATSAKVTSEAEGAA